LTGSPLPSDWKKTLILIERQVEQGFRPIGTGFLIEHQKANVLVTCRHIALDKEGTKIPNLFFTYNTKAGSLIRRPQSEQREGGVDWVFHADKDVDIAVTLFRYDSSTEEPMRIGHDLFASISEIDEGEDLLYLGFPLGHVQADKVRPIVRSGTVALVLPNGNYLMDASVSTGNSGSPVFTKPSAINWRTRTLGEVVPAKLIGMVTSFLPIQDVAYSAQTSGPRVVFEENSGLSTVVGCKFLDEVLASSDFTSQFSLHVRQSSPSA